VAATLSFLIISSRDDRGAPRRWVQPGEDVMSLIIYLIGFAFVIGGIAWALIVAGLSTLYVMIAIVILVGVAILTGVTRTRTKD
jgi:amino acid transporter